MERHAKDQEARALDCEARAKAAEVGTMGEAGRRVAKLGAVSVVVVVVAMACRLGPRTRRVGVLRGRSCDGDGSTTGDGNTDMHVSACGDCVPA